MCWKLGEKCTQHGSDRFRSCTQRISVAHNTVKPHITQKNNQLFVAGKVFTNVVSMITSLPSTTTSDGQYKYNLSIHFKSITYKQLAQF